MLRVHGGKRARSHPTLVYGVSSHCADLANCCLELGLTWLWVTSTRLLPYDCVEGGKRALCLKEGVNVLVYGGVFLYCPKWFLGA